jgi:hypothetical protein
MQLKKRRGSLNFGQLITLVFLPEEEMGRSTFAKNDVHTLRSKKGKVNLPETEKVTDRLRSSCPAVPS